MHTNTTENRKLPVFQSVSSAWKAVKGLKGSCWGGIALTLLIHVAFFVLVALGVFILAAVTGYPGSPEQLEHLGAGGGQILGIGMQTILWVLMLFIIIPVDIGLLLIPIRKFTTGSTSAFTVFNYYGWRFMWRFAVSYFLVSLLATIVALVLLLIGYLLMSLISAVIPVQGVGFLIYLLFGIAAGISIFYFSTAMILACMVIAQEETTLRHGLRKSFSACWHNLFRLIGLYIVAGVIMMLFYGLPILLAVMLAHMNMGLIGGLLLTVLAIVFSIWLIPFMLSLQGKIYVALFGDEKNENAHNTQLPEQSASI